MEKCYYARSANASGEKETLCHHLERASQLCGEYLEPIGFAKIGNILGRLHDFGKYSQSFAEVLERKRVHVNHSYPGAALVYGLYGKNTTVRMLATVIAAHHSHLDNTCISSIPALLRGEGAGCDEDGNTFSLFGKEEMEDAIASFQQENPSLMQMKISPIVLTDKRPIAQMLFVRFLLSALADADYSSSAEHFQPDYLKLHTGSLLKPEEVMERLFRLREEKQKNSTSSRALNQLRDQLFDCCLDAAKEPPGLFTLTAPTGLGKTLSLFAFAAQHCIEHKQMRRIILILPFLAIIEQNVKDYRKLIPELLESHSAADLSDDSRLLAERWAVPCIITTNVGFFEPLFSAKPTDCRRLHQIANSVIVLDEAQSLPSEVLEATLETVKLLCSQYGCTVVFSTATQPSFQHISNLNWCPKEIVPNPQQLFQQTRRVTYEWRIKQPVSYEQIAKEITMLNQCCIIVNLRAHARKLFRLLEAEKPGSVFFLTSDLCRSHRRQVLEKVKSCLEQNEPCYLIASQVIEAGVDLSFPVVYRALAPLEAIIQAAGRCNRNGSGPDGRMIVFLPDEEELYPPGPYYKRAAICVKNLASRHPIDAYCLAHIEEYYQLLYANRDGDKAELSYAISELDYQKVQQEYRLIDSKGVQVIVPYEEELELFLSIQQECDKAGLTKEIMDRAKPITVSSFDVEKVKSCCMPLFFYNQERADTARTDWFLLGNRACYQDSVGLNFEALEEFDGIW